MTDPIADMLTRLRNASLAGKAIVIIPFSRVRERLVQILLEAGYLTDITPQPDKGPAKSLLISLKYFNQVPAITGIKRESKPGRRLYQKASRLPRILSGKGLAIVSTSAGIMPVTLAHQKRLGGELLCIVW